MFYLYSGIGYPCAEQIKDKCSDKDLTNQLDFEEDGNVGDLNPIGSVFPQKYKQWIDKIFYLNVGILYPCAKHNKLIIWSIFFTYEIDLASDEKLGAFNPIGSIIETKKCYF